ncbi:alkaline phosphatase [bacterium]|nr:alkaline phosphatase [bacterium]
MLDLTKIAEAVRYEGGLSRRLFLSYTAGLAALPLLAQRTSAADRKVTFSDNPFSLGVASGDPASRSVVLWTRLAPKPLEPQGGMSPEPIAVKWELADDEAMTKIVKQGTAIATPQLAHSVHVEARGLEPDRWYFYRFHVGDAVSPVGRTRTLPAADASPDRLRFAFASCQHYETGLYTAYEHMAKDDLDLVFHLGDYIYEGPGKAGKVRQHVGPEIHSLSDYRVRHAQYRSDPLLHGMHAVCPWFVTWDDHEFDNNYAAAISEEADFNPVAFLERRANAYQAYYEAMPLRRQQIPQGADMQLYRKASYGQLAELMILDTRQYRSDQPNGDKHSVINDEALNPHSTMLGSKQRGWLQTSLLTSEATWNVLAQQVMMGMAAIARSGVEGKSSMDQWPGYAHERMALMKFIQERQIPNAVVLTGDIHSNWANELRVDDRKQDEPVVATEFVGTSITSGGNGKQTPEYFLLLHGANPFVKYHSSERGYVRCTVTPENWTSDYIAVEDVTKPGGNVVTRMSFVVEAGNPALHKI